MPVESETQNAYSIQMNFQEFLSDELRETCGYIRFVKQDATNPQIFWESYMKPEEYKEMAFLCNLDGGLAIVHGLHKFFNKHLQLGNIKTSQVASKAGQITRQVFGNMHFEPERYGIKDLDAFSENGLTTQDQLEVFFTTVANSGIRDWSGKILTITQANNGAPINAEPYRPAGLLDRARAAISGSRDMG